jgi:hypothetical protein
MSTEALQAAIIIVRVDNQRRFELDPSLLQSTVGLKIASGHVVDLWALTGGGGQLQVLGQENELSKMRQQYEAQVTKDPPSLDVGGDENTAVLRRLASLLPIRFCAEKGRRKLRISLPPEAMHLDLMKPKDWIVVFSVGEILEFWSKTTWLTTSKIEDVREFTKQAKETLDL